MRSKWLDDTAVSTGKELINSDTSQEWYITSYYILGEDVTTKRVHFSHRNVRHIPVPPHLLVLNPS